MFKRVESLVCVCQSRAHVLQGGAFVCLLEVWYFSVHLCNSIDLCMYSAGVACPVAVWYGALGCAHVLIYMYVYTYSDRVGVSD